LNKVAGRQPFFLPISRYKTTLQRDYLGRATSAVTTGENGRAEFKVQAARFPYGHCNWFDYIYPVLLSAKLKENTRENHQALEKKLVSKMRAMRSKQDYLDVLYIFYSYFGGIEQLIANYDLAVLIPDHALRRKAGSLAADIEALGGKLPALAAIHFLPAVKNIQDCLGALYVLEGSTLGGQLITQLLQKQLGLSEGLTFFQSYGGATPVMWQKFQAVLDRPEHLPGGAIIAAANDTFSKFSSWFNLNQ
jgi:heme oxygenase